MSPQKKKMPATKKPAPKKAALKKKIESKRTAKVGKIVAKENAHGKKMAISKSSEERAARVSRRGLAKEAPAAKEPQRKRARLDVSCDLVVKNTFGMEDTYELDRLIGASPASASVLAIIAASASASRTLPKEASAEDREAVGE